MKNLDDCLSEIYAQGSSDIDGLFKYSISCEKQKDQWYFDAYKNASVNDTLTEEYQCGECGKTAVKKLIKLLQNMKSNNSNDYEALKSKIDDLKICNINNDICEPSKFAGCFSTLRNGKAEEHCKKNGKCSETVMNQLNDCFEYIYSISSTNSTKKINLKVFNNFFKNFNSSFTFSCESSDGVWCYDEYENSLKNKTKMKEFKSSKCGQIAI